MKLSRRQVASYLADGLSDDRPHRIQRVAAWLVANHHGHDAGYVSRDVASKLTTSGYITATVRSAKPLSPELTSKASTTIKQITGASTVEVAQTLDPNLIGGIIIDLPDARFDASVRNKLGQLTSEMTS